MERILVPVDFSSHSLAAADLGLALARRHGAELCLLHALDLAVYGEGDPRVWEAYLADRRGAAGQQLSGLAEQLSGATIDTALRSGDPGDVILAVANERRADLIVMGSYGRNGGQRFLMGSVAGRVAREAPCPVLVTREGNTNTGVFHHAVVAVDYARLSLRAARVASRLVGRDGIVELVHVARGPVAVDDAALGAARSAALTDQLQELQRFARAKDLAPARIAARIDTGHPADEILAHVASAGADLVAAGAHGKSAHAAHLGTVADRLLRGAPVPVLLIPDPASAVANDRGGRG